MTLAQFKCGLGCGWVTYPVGAYGQDGPIELHFLSHHDHLTRYSNQDGAVNAALTVGLMSRKGANTVAPQPIIRMTAQERWEQLEEALRIKERAEALQPVLAHYSAMVAEAYEDLPTEALGERVSIPKEKLDALLLELNERRAGQSPSIDADLLFVPGVAE